VLMRQQLGRPYEVTPQPTVFLPPVPRRTVVAAAGAAAGGAVLDAARRLGNICISDSSSSSNHNSGSTSSHNSSSSSIGSGTGSDGHEPLKLLAHEGCRERIGEYKGLCVRVQVVVTTVVCRWWCVHPLGKAAVCT
jgi:hypothetical protein